jgi:hypothetical protein
VFGRRLLGIQFVKRILSTDSIYDAYIILVMEKYMTVQKLKHDGSFSSIESFKTPITFYQIESCYTWLDDEKSESTYLYEMMELINIQISEQLKYIFLFIRGNNDVIIFATDKENPISTITGKF